MRRCSTSIVGTSLLTLGLSACGGSATVSTGGTTATVNTPSSGTAVVSAPVNREFPGLYVGPDNNTTEITSPLSRREVEQDPQSRVRIGTDGDAFTVTQMNTPNGAAPCTIRATRTGDTLSIVPNQSCTQPRYGISVTATTQSGSVALTNEGVSVEMTMGVSGTFMNRPLAGTLVYRFTGRRADGVQ